MNGENKRHKQSETRSEAGYFTSIRDTLELNLPAMSQRQAQLGRYILDHITEVPCLSAAELADRADVSEPTVIRFARGLGYAGYQDLRKERTEISQSLSWPRRQSEEFP